jgi:hypothetical protein
MKYVRNFVVDGVVENANTVRILVGGTLIHIARSHGDEIDILFCIDGIDFTFYSGIINANEICVGDLSTPWRMEHF